MHAVEFGDRRHDVSQAGLLNFAFPSSFHPIRSIHPIPFRLSHTLVINVSLGLAILFSSIFPWLWRCILHVR